MRPIRCGATRQGGNKYVFCDVGIHVASACENDFFGSYKYRRWKSDMTGECPDPEEGVPAPPGCWVFAQKELFSGDVKIVSEQGMQTSAWIKCLSFDPDKNGCIAQKPDGTPCSPCDADCP